MKKKFIMFLLIIGTLAVYSPIKTHKTVPTFAPSSPPKQETTISVFNQEKNKTENHLLEEYLIGVVAAEMPAEYSEEALKAQAVAARTYILNKKEKEIPVHNDADICTSPAHCKAYVDKNSLKKKWGDSFSEYYEKIKNAVSKTENLIITHDGAPIEAYFFALSNGKTENPRDVWGGELPYLFSVDSSFDKNAKNFEEKKAFSLSDFNSRLGFSQGASPRISHTEKTKGGRVKSIIINDSSFSGNEIRNIFSLASTDFSIEKKKNQIIFTTKGRGHGVGMSQFGANELAKSGKTFSEILLHYYRGCKIEDFTKQSF